MKNQSVILKKRRPDNCVTENYIKKFIPVTIPGNINFANISKNGRKILFVRESQVKRIRRIYFNKKLRNGKADFCFSGTTSSWVITSYFHSLMICHMLSSKKGTNDILHNASCEDIAWNLIRIGWNCKSHAVFFISSILVLKKSNVKYTYQTCKWYVAWSLRY